VLHEDKKDKKCQQPSVEGDGSSASLSPPLRQDHRGLSTMDAFTSHNTASC